VTGRSLTARLVAGTLLWVAAALTVGGIALSYAFKESVEASFTARLESLLLALVAATEVHPDGTVRLARSLDEPRFEQVYSGWYWQIDSPAGIGLRSRSLWDESLPAAPAAKGGTIENDRGERLRLAARDVTWPQWPTPLQLRVAVDEREVTRETARFNRLLVLSLGGLGLGLVAAVLIQVGFGLRPLRRVARDLERIRSGEIAALPRGYPAEVEPLARAMNDVLEHDAALIERARTHVGNLAHALKTPLSLLKAEAGSGPPILAEQVNVMHRLIQHHLARAAAAGTARGPTARTEIAPVAQALRDGIARLYAERGLLIEVDVAAGMLFHGERQDLEEMLGNLVDNACKWATQRVRIGAASSAEGVRLTVDDDGPGLAPEHAAQAVRRGTRLDTETPGSGLGLTIASDLAALYGGALELDASPFGGLRASLRLPGGTAPARA
jgi:signal transduction histidine kinase